MNADNSVHLFLSFNKRTSKYYILFIEHINLTQMVDFYSFGEIQVLCDIVIVFMMLLCWNSNKPYQLQFIEMKTGK